MIKLKDLEAAMRGQFVFDKEPQKYFQTDEVYEGSKDLARSIFVGLADMYGFEGGDVTDYLDMGYDSYRYKLSQFKDYYRKGSAGTDDPVISKYYVKIQLCLNSIGFLTRRNQYLKLEEYINI